MAKDDHKPEQPKEPEPSDVGKLAEAINSLADKGKPKDLPPGGPHPTNAKGEKIQPNCEFYERDGSKWDAILEREREIEIKYKISDDKWEVVKRKSYDLRVNFRRKDIDNWVPVSGISVLTELRNQYRKRHVKFPAKA